MKFNFDQLMDRTNTNAVKWNVKDHALAMWVADMDFQTAPCVQQAIEKIAAFGIFGYSDIPEAYYISYQQWWCRRHKLKIEKEWMIFSSGVVPAISSIVRKLTTPAEKVLIQSPVYNIFYNSILNNGREVISSDLIYENGEYQIDFHDLEVKLQDPQTTMMILCNPHNPIGKIWSAQDLEKIGTLCHTHHVVVVSDEIHCDITQPNKHYTPYASVNEQCRLNSITCIAASKAFNLAGLQAACIVVPNEGMRHKVWRGLHTDEVGEPNIFACDAVIAAFQHGEEWLEALRAYISTNKKTAHLYFKKHLPHVPVIQSEATYLLWMDCTVFHPFVEQFSEYLHKEKQLVISYGGSFGKNGEDFIRMNIACPQERMMEGLKKFREGFEEFSNIFLNIRS